MNDTLAKPEVKVILPNRKHRAIALSLSVCLCKHASLGVTWETVEIRLPCPAETFISRDNSLTYAYKTAVHGNKRSVQECNVTICKRPTTQARGKGNGTLRKTLSVSKWTSIYNIRKDERMQSGIGKKNTIDVKQLACLQCPIVLQRVNLTCLTLFWWNTTGWG